MNFNEACQEKIDEIMDMFDFSNAKKIMDLLNWKWASVDTDKIQEYQLRIEARRLLKNVVKMLKKEKNGRLVFTETGGLAAYGVKNIENGKPWVNLWLYFGQSWNTDGIDYS